MNLEIGQTLYGCNYKTKNISFDYELITGLKIKKVKIKKITDKYIMLDIGDRETQRISKERIGKSLFTTKKEIVEYIITEDKRRIKEKESSDRNQKFNEEHLEYLKKDLKKWQKFAKNTSNEEVKEK